MEKEPEQIFQAMIRPLDFVLSAGRSHGRVYTDREVSFRKITVVAV